MSTQQKNGTTIPTNGTNGKKVNTTVSMTVVKKDEEQKPEPKQEPVKPPSSPLEDRLYRISQLFELQTKHARLNASVQKLDAFTLNKGGENISLTITDDENPRVEEFTTSNPEVVAEVLAFIRTTIIARRKKIEDLLVI